jgi:hypothetical protein
MNNQERVTFKEIPIQVNFADVINQHCPTIYRALDRNYPTKNGLYNFLATAGSREIAQIEADFSQVDVKNLPPEEVRKFSEIIETMKRGEINSRGLYYLQALKQGADANRNKRTYAVISLGVAIYSGLLNVEKVENLPDFTIAISILIWAAISLKLANNYSMKNHHFEQTVRKEVNETFSEDATNLAMTIERFRGVFTEVLQQEIADKKVPEIDPNSMYKFISSNFLLKYENLINMEKYLDILLSQCQKEDKQIAPISEAKALINELLLSVHDIETIIKD